MHLVDKQQMSLKTETIQESKQNMLQNRAKKLWHHK